MEQVKNILVYLEDEVDSAALSRAAKVAQAARARLTLATVVEPARSHMPLAKQGYDPEKIQRMLVEERRSWLEDAAALISDLQVEVVIRVFVGDPVEVLLQSVQDEEFDFLAKTPALRQQLFGSIDMHLMRGCRCPVLISRPKTDGYSGRAVAAVSYDVGDDVHARLNHEILESAAYVLRTQEAGAPVSLHYQTGGCRETLVADIPGPGAL